MPQKNIIDGTVAQDMQDAHDNFTELYAQQSINTDKLSGIEAGATADQTGAEIKAAYEAESDTNVFTDADNSKLDGIEVGANVTNATSVAGAGAVMNTGNETVAGVKTFSSSPIVPTPTTDMQVPTKGYTDKRMPSGGIIMWSGTIANIPSGWALCDGTNSTPNLTDRFVLPADADTGGTNNVGDTGGTKTISVSNLPEHTHNAGTLGADSAGAHTHSYTRHANQYQYAQTGGSQYGAEGNYTTGSSGTHTHTISGSTASAGSGTDYMQKYYALAYIMKL